MLYNVMLVFAIQYQESIGAIYMGLPGGSDSKESACNARELDSIPGCIPSLLDLYYVEVAFLCAHFLERFYHK